MEPILPTAEIIEARARELGVPMRQLLLSARVADSIFYRWRSGGTINSATLERLLRALRSEERAAEVARNTG